MSLTAIGDAEGLRAALAGGQKYDALDSSERTPLMLAAYISAVDCIPVLVEAAERAGGDDAVQAYLDAKDDRTGSTALHRAVVYGSEATIRVGRAVIGAASYASGRSGVCPRLCTQTETRHPELTHMHAAPDEYPCQVMLWG